MGPPWYAGRESLSAWDRYRTPYVKASVFDQLQDLGTGSQPAVALTTFFMESDRQAAPATGFQAYVAKPITLPVWRRPWPRSAGAALSSTTN